MIKNNVNGMGKSIEMDCISWQVCKEVTEKWAKWK